MNRTEEVESRRNFLKKAALAAAAFPLLVNCKVAAGVPVAKEDLLTLIKKNAMPAGTEGMGAIEAPANISWKTVLSEKSDKDVPLIISGTVFEPDGKTPAPNVLIYFYHTDSEGYYGKGAKPVHGHFRGWLLTDAQGRYEFSTIKPASYPNQTFAAHIHMTVTGKNFREDWLDSILFEGDKFISVRERSQAGRKGGFNPILPLEKNANGILHGIRNIQLPKA